MISTVLPLAPRTTSPGRIAVPLGMFSVVGITAMHRVRRLEPRQRAHRAGHRRTARHVVLHPLHAVGGLDGNAAGVERNALPDEPQHRPPGRRRRAMAEHDHARRFGTALPDRQQHAHAQIANLSVVKHLDVQTDAGRGLRRHAAANSRGVRMLAGSLASARVDVRALGDHPAAPNGGVHPRRVAARHRDLDATGVDAGTGAIVLVDAALEFRRRESIGDVLRDPVAVRATYDEPDRVSAAPPRRVAAGRRDTSRAQGVGLGKRSGPDQRDALRAIAPAANDRRDKRVIQLRAELSRGAGAPDLATRGLVEARLVVERIVRTVHRNEKQVDGQIVGRGDGAGEFHAEKIILQSAAAPT